MCANGKPVPVQSADWQRFVQGLRDAGMTGAELSIDGGILAGSAAAPVARDSDER